MVFLILHNIRSVHNVGSIFRTADAAGVSKIFLIGVTPTPVDRFGRMRKDLAKVSLGAERTVPWEHSKQFRPVGKRLRRDGFSLVAVEQSPWSKNFRYFRAPKKTAFIFGNEVGGLPKSILRSADAIVEIPMHGKKESLNVAVSAGVILFIVRNAPSRSPYQ